MSCPLAYTCVWLGRRQAGRQAGRQERLDHGRKVFCRGGKGKGSASPNTPGSGSYDGGRLIAAAEGLLLALL